MTMDHTDHGLNNGMTMDHTDHGQDNLCRPLLPGGPGLGPGPGPFHGSVCLWVCVSVSLTWTVRDWRWPEDVGHPMWTGSTPHLPPDVGIWWISSWVTDELPSVAQSELTDEWCCHRPQNVVMCVCGYSSLLHCCLPWALLSWGIME